MKLKHLLLVLLFWGGIASAQDTIDYLVITECRIDATHQAYLELTNMHDTKTVQLSEFHIGHWGGGDELDYATGFTAEEDHVIPFDKILQPGESFLIGSWDEYEVRMFHQAQKDGNVRGMEINPERQQQQNILDKADYLVNLDSESDSLNLGNLRDHFNSQWGPGMNGFYIEHHFDNGSGVEDSAVVDQVCGMFDREDGTNKDRTEGSGYDVAGVEAATGNAYLIRRNTVKKGNLDFASARGIGLDDSEWIPILIRGGSYRLAPWTIGNQGAYNLDANTLESDIITVDFANKKLTVPWGVRRGDDIMSNFVEKPGVGWDYLLGPGTVEDSLTWAAQTGDQLVIYVCGDDLDQETFDIVVSDPTANENRVVPVMNEGGDIQNSFDGGNIGWPRVTQDVSGNDTIWGYTGGIPYATRIDSLIERLDIPSNAEWEFVYAGADAKPEISNGDKLKVTASDGSVKEYYIKVLDYLPSHIASLSSITWPDIPEFYKGLFGWIGDTIPGFGPSNLNYNVEVPLLAKGIPAFVAKANDPNADVQGIRAKSLSGSAEDRTAQFIVTADDDTTIYNYKITLTKEAAPDDIQPYAADPIISEVVYNQGWANNDMMEVYNPGNLPLDLSNYMFVGEGVTSPPDAITFDNADSWLDRYAKYIPGYKWQDEANWVVQPYIAEPDLSVNKIVQPGDVFVMAALEKDWGGDRFSNPDNLWPGIYQTDVHFHSAVFPHKEIINQWNEETDRTAPFTERRAGHIWLFKILNDSIQRGLKSATDPNDFQLIDVFGMPGNDTWEIEGGQMGNPASVSRKPEFTQGNPVVGASFGNDTVSGEWIVGNLDSWGDQGYGWPARMILISSDIGKHFALPATSYKSTISSLVYKVSSGYSMNEQLTGVTTGTTVSELFDGIIKADAGQTLTVTATAGGAELAMDAVVSNSDTLTVLSADSVNTSKYILEVTEFGLSSDALLTSSAYDVSVTTQPSGSTFGVATISGMPYGTTLKEVVGKVTVPVGAYMEIIDARGAYVPLKVANYDTMYVDLSVSTGVYFEVIAEDGVTGIVYQLTPESDLDVFLTSDIFTVNQDQLLVSDVPGGIGTQSFISKLQPSPGATIKVFDKLGFERLDGNIYADDRVVVSSGDMSAVYYISVLTSSVDFLAYITSTTYIVDQVGSIVNGVGENTSVSDFLASIAAATGATAIVVDASGVEKTSGVIEQTDMVKVTSGDESIEVMYSFGELVVSVELSTGQQIQVYPNPSSGSLNVTGLEFGQRIKVYNSVGSLVVDRHVQNSHEILSIDERPAGLYMIVIGDKDQLIGRYKFIKY